MPGAPRDASLAALMAKAGRVVGGRDFRDLGFVPALELLLASCSVTGELNERGRRVLDSVVVRHLCNRLLVEAEMAGRVDPIAPVGPAIVVTGLPRTGTTLLHNLLSQDPAFRALRLWEALRPVPVDSEHGWPEAQLIGQAAIWLERLYDLAPSFRAIHAATPEGPEECDALLQNDFASQHFDDMFNAEAYSDWLATASLQREYRSYARQLGILRRPADENRPWVLKSPSHLGHLDALLDACPEVTIVHCHRHPSEAVPSYASLVLCLRQAYSDAASPAAVGQQALRRCETALSRAQAVRQAVPDRFVDMAYTDLVRRPGEVVGALYERLGRPLPRGVERSVASWVARHPQHQHGVHRYAGEDFGLSPKAITEGFAAYLDQLPSPLG